MSPHPASAEGRGTASWAERPEGCGRYASPGAVHPATGLRVGGTPPWQAGCRPARGAGKAREVSAVDSGAGGQFDKRGPSRGWPATTYIDGRPRGRSSRERRPAPGWSSGGGAPWRLITVVLAGVVALGALVVACGILPGSSGPSKTPSPSGSTAAIASGNPSTSPAASQVASASTSPEASASAGASPSPSVAAGSVALAVVGGFDNYKVNSITTATLASRLTAGTLIVPCGAESAVAKALGTSGRGAAACVAADRITASLDPASTKLALVPPALVTPRVKVVPLGGADLFGEKPARGKAYPLSIATPASWPAAWSQWSSKNVRVVVITGCTCPDRGVSHQTVVLKKGWNWLLQAGTARYTGRHWFAPMGWWVVDAVRSGNGGALVDLIKNADIAESDFECQMTKSFSQHDDGTLFTVDPRVAPMMAAAGFDVATIASDHMSNPYPAAVAETANAFRKAGIQPTGGGANLSQALQPAVIDAGGLKFGFVGLNAIGSSIPAAATRAGTATLTAANAKTAIDRAKAAGAKVIIALPQWSSSEYHANFTPFQDNLINVLTNAGADHIAGADFHWAGGLQVSRNGSTYQYVGSSQGNFWFGQNWSRQTQEGVITSLTFVGTNLAQVRLTPTVVLDNAQVNLTNPATDGQFVLKQVLGATTLPTK